MRSFPFSLRIPHPLHACAISRQQTVSYRAFCNYINGLILCDQMIQRSHEHTEWFFRQRRNVQDFIYDCLPDWIPAPPGTQPDLSHAFCHCIIDVMMRRHRCNAGLAVRFLPVAVRDLCAECGFC